MTLSIRLCDHQKEEETFAVRLWYNQLNPDRTRASATECVAGRYISNGTDVTTEGVARIV